MRRARPLSVQRQRNSNLTLELCNAREYNEVATRTSGLGYVGRTVTACDRSLGLAARRDHEPC